MGNGSVPAPDPGRNAGREALTAASAARPCPVCGGGHKCSTGDGGLILCGRRDAPVPGFRHLGPSAGDPQFHLYRTGPAGGGAGRTPKARVKDWPALARRYAEGFGPAAREELAARLRLPAWAFDALPGLGVEAVARSGRTFTFPECDGAGAVIGINRRLPDGSKKLLPGGRRGLTLVAGWRSAAGPVYLAEGPSDTLALAAAGLAAVGRPSNTGGVPHLTALLAGLDPGREVVALGENDRKPDGTWPGRDGAERAAAALARALGRPVRWALPPEGAKDARDWLTAETRGDSPWSDRGRELTAHLTAAVAVDPPDDPPAGAAAPPGMPNDGPDNPHRLATDYLNEVCPDRPPLRLRFWRGEFHRYHGGAYRSIPDADLRGELAEWVRAEFLRANVLELAAWRARSGDKGPPPQVRKVTVSLVSNVLQALGGACLVPAVVETPAWIDGTTGPDPAAVLPVANGLLDLHALADQRPECLLSPSPSFFTPTALPFAFDPHAPPPAEWLQFLASVWPDDPDSIGCLQEWFGYLLTPDTRQQKILFLLGPRRGGKGTVARVLRALVGPANVAGPTLGNLATNFGLQPLLGMSVAVVADARLSGRADAATITERLLSVSGEDALTIDRKHRDPLTVKLNTRFVIISNELPRLGDTSGALAGRLILLRLTRSFYGREDHGLLDRLRAELPGILLWAVAGWRRLRDRGRFAPPPSGAELVADLEDLSSPVGAFVRERCVLGTGFRVEVSELYREWRSWCDQHGRKEPGTEETFGRDLRAAVPSVEKQRPRVEGRRVHEYAGIRLRTPADPEDDTPAGRPGHRGHSDPPLHATRQEKGDGRHAEPEGEDPDGEYGTVAGHGDHHDHGARPLHPPAGRLFDHDYREWLPPDGR